MNMRILYLVLLLLVQGCASNTTAMLARPQKVEAASFAFNGRVATKHEGERSSAGVRWTHRGVEDEILLLAPLGQTVARIHGDAHGVTLETDGKIFAASDAESLTEQVLGWHLPMSGMRHWVLGLPATGSTADIEHDALGQITVMRQDGWEIRYLKYASEAADSLPIRMLLQRNGMEMRLFIDEWEAL